MYIQSNTFLFADAFKSFFNKCIKIFKLHPVHFLTGPVLTLQVCLKNIETKFELLTDIDMLLMVKKGIRSGLYHVIHRYAKANNKYMKN